MKHIFILLATGIILSSCGTQRKIEETRKAIAVLKEKQRSETDKIGSVKDFSVAKLDEGKIDKNIKYLIDNRLSRYMNKMDSSRRVLDTLESLTGNKKKFRKGYKEIVLPALDSFKKETSTAGDRLKIYMMIEDGLNVASYHLFDLAAFFGSGKYIIPEDKVDFAQTSFAPIVDSLILFSNKYNDRPRTASLLILGFADGAGFSEGPLYDTLKIMTGKENATKEELNQKLSELRARELIKHLEQIYKQKQQHFPITRDFRIEYIGQGKGEEYPLPTIKDYMVEDARRRIVLCYWIVLPD